MDRADTELKDTIRNIWPIQAKKMIDLLVPPHDRKIFFLGRLHASMNSFWDHASYYVSDINEGKLTVGKIYAGLQILECWRATKFKKIDNGNPPVSIIYQLYLMLYALSISIVVISTMKLEYYNIDNMNKVFSPHELEEDEKLKDSVSGWFRWNFILMFFTKTWWYSRFLLIWKWSDIFVSVFMVLWYPLQAAVGMEGKK